MLILSAQLKILWENVGQKIQAASEQFRENEINPDRFTSIDFGKNCRKKRFFPPIYQQPTLNSFDQHISTLCKEQAINEIRHSALKQFLSMRFHYCALAFLFFKIIEKIIKDAIMGGQNTI